MNKEVIILIVEDDTGHAGLIRKNLARAGIANQIIHFTDGEQVIDYFFNPKSRDEVKKPESYLLLLDIRMPKMSGIDVLRKLKENEQYRKIPVIMITTTDDPAEIALCHQLGCSSYITKPIDYDKFVEVIRQLGLFLLIIEVPNL
jgi:CheY-like chemotaxis protein